MVKYDWVLKKIAAGLGGTTLCHETLKRYKQEHYIKFLQDSELNKDVYRGIIKKDTISVQKIIESRKKVQ